MLTSVSFKWVINRYLPTVSYLTSLDKYSIFGTTFLCTMSIWHGVVGRFWLRETAVELDNIFFWVFFSLFILTNFGFMAQFVYAHMCTVKLKEREAEFLRKFRETFKRDYEHNNNNHNTTFDSF